MSAAVAADRRLCLPPGFEPVAPAAGEDVFPFACRNADRLGAGALVWASGREQLDLAVVLEPEEPLRTARRAFLVGMGALLDGLGSVAPPDKPLTVLWPDTIQFDGARLGGGRLGWPAAAEEEAVPRCLVFGASLILSKARSGDPGLTPGSTSFEEEGFEPGSDLPLVESFARHLLRAFDAWREGAFETAVAGFLRRLSGPEAVHGVRPDGVGNLVRPDGVRCGTALASGLVRPSWLDDAAGTVRL